MGIEILQLRKILNKPMDLNNLIIKIQKINCESDFVAMNSDFANLVEKMAAYVNRLQNSWNESSKDLQEHIQNSEHINSMLIENNLKFKVIASFVLILEF